MATQLIDLHHLSSCHLADLLDEETGFWKREFHWDYHLISRLIRNCLDEGCLSGYSIFEDSEALGYGFFVFDGKKATIGNLFVSSRVSRAAYGRLLLGRVIRSLQQTSGIERIEAQLPPFPSDDLRSCFEQAGFHVFPRRFMMLNLEHGAESSFPSGEQIALRPWDGKYERALAVLVQDAYREHVDSRINLQYLSPRGTLQVIENVTRHRGCGEFHRDASLVAVHVPSGMICGAVLVTSVGKANGHIPQVCIAPHFQGRRIGSSLLSACVRRLGRDGYRNISLTVTDENSPAIRLYQRLGFRTLRRFGAYVWNRPKGDSSFGFSPAK